MTLDAGVRERLCRVTPTGFVAERDAVARELRSAGRKDDATAVKALRRPSVPLWTVNELARRQPAGIQGLIAVAARLKSAQRDALRPEGASALREAMRLMRELTTTLVEQADSGVHADRVRALLQAAAGGSDVVVEQLRTGTLLDEPEAADVSDVLSLMTGAAPPPPGVETARVEQRLRAEDLSIDRLAEGSIVRLAVVAAGPAHAAVRDDVKPLRSLPLPQLPPLARIAEPSTSLEREARERAARRLELDGEMARLFAEIEVHRADLAAAAERATSLEQEARRASAEAEEKRAALSGLKQRLADVRSLRGDLDG